MNIDELIKYIIWIAFFGFVLAGMYFMLTKMDLVHGFKEFFDTLNKEERDQV